MYCCAHKTATLTQIQHTVLPAPSLATGLLCIGLANIKHLVSLTNTWVFDAIMCYLKKCNLVHPKR